MSTTIHFLIGDATAPLAQGHKIICHVCNDVGAWGRGFVLALSRKWPGPERAYREWHRNREGNDFGLGAVQLVQVESDLWVANMIGQHGLKRQGGRPPIRYEALESCLRKVAQAAKANEASVHMPRIGCGLAGDTWEEIEPLIRRTLCDQGVAVVVYDLR